jgi:hypothetical protein
MTWGLRGYAPDTMDEVERSERPDDRDGLWREALSSLALIGSVLILVFLISLFGRL